MLISQLTVGLLGTNSYLVRDREAKQAVLIDPGAESARLLAELGQDRLMMILLTHAHFDHILAADDVRKKTGAPLFVHTDDAELLGDGEKNGSMSVLCRDLTVSPADRLLKSGEEIPFGNSAFRVLHTPGHTRGSVCYLFGNTLFTGDTLFAGAAGRTDLYGGSGEMLLRSLKKLRDLPGDFDVLPGHGEATSLGEERRLNEYLNLF